MDTCVLGKRPDSKASARHFADLVASALIGGPVSVFVCDAQRIIRFVNDYAVERTGFSREELVGRPIGRRKSGHTPSEAYQDLDAVLDQGRVWVGEFRNRSKSGALYWDAAMIRPVTDAAGRITHYVSIQVDITESKLRQQDLEQKHEQVERRNHAKTSHLRHMSHELRTPLNAILGFAQIMDQHLAEGRIDKTRHYLRYVADSASFMLDLVNDILDLERLEAGHYVLREETVVLRAVMADCVGLLAPAAGKGEVHLSCDLAMDLPPVRADQRALRQILLNLLSNAVKFTPAGGRITVRAVRARDGGITLSVTDSGIGMSADELAAATEEFRQADNDYTRRFRGSGLGLPLTRSLVALHGGALGLESRAGQGTTATVHLPPFRVLQHPNG